MLRPSFLRLQDGFRPLHLNLVEGRVDNVIGLNLKNAVNDSRQGLHHFQITVAAVSVRARFLVPETDSERIRSARGDAGDFVSEPFLSSKDWNDFLPVRPGKLLSTIGFQVHGNFESKHVSLLVAAKRVTSDNHD